MQSDITAEVGGQRGPVRVLDLVTCGLDFKCAADNAAHVRNGRFFDLH